MYTRNMFSIGFFIYFPGQKKRKENTTQKSKCNDLLINENKLQYLTFKKDDNFFQFVGLKDIVLASSPLGCVL